MRRPGSLALQCGMLVFAMHILNQNVGASTYEVRKIPANSLTVDGLIVETQWQAADVACPDFHWNGGQLPKTEFRALWDDEFFFFAFDVEDSEIVTADSIGGEPDIGDEDRVELFLATGRIDAVGDAQEVAGTPVYYGLEIDSKGRTMDFLGRYYRRLDLDWTLPELRVGAHATDHGYGVEGRIPIIALTRLGLLKPGRTMLAGVFRAEFRKPPADIAAKWLSWQDPETAEPDFHVPSAFGTFEFVEPARRLRQADEARQGAGCEEAGQ